MPRREGCQTTRSVVAVHRQTYPDDPELIIWDPETRWLKKDYDGSLQLLTDHRDDVFARQRNQWKADNYRVRCLVKLNRTKEAIEAAEAVVKKKYGNRLLLILAYAASGNVKKTIAVLEAEKIPAYLLDSCYRDEDLGPILRGESFKEFREKYPEKKEKEGVER